MKKWQLWLIGFVTMFSAVGLAVLIVVVFDGGNWSFIPMILWFILGQIFLVPKILEKEIKK